LSQKNESERLKQKFPWYHIIILQQKNCIYNKKFSEGKIPVLLFHDGAGSDGRSGLMNDGIENIAAIALGKRTQRIIQQNLCSPLRLSTV